MQLAGIEGKQSEYIETERERGEDDMDLKVFRDMVSVSQQLCDLTLEHPVETEILIPDYQPEIFKIVKSFVTPVLLQKQVLGGKLTLEGYLRVSVLYQGEEEQNLCQVEQKLPFSKSVELKNGEYDSYRVSVRGESEYLNTRAINSRRIDVKGAYAFGVIVSGQSEQQVVTALSGEGAQQKLTAVPFTRIVAECEKNFSVEDTLEFPDVPLAVLYTNCTGTVDEIRLISGKAVVKGRLQVRVVYRSEPGYQLEHAEKELPFNQIIDLEHLDEECSCHVEIVPHGCTLVEGGGEENATTLSVSCGLSLLILRQNMVYAVCDAFSTRWNAQVTTRQLVVEHLVDDFHNTITASGSGALPDEGCTLVDCLATVLPPETVTDAGEITIRGKVIAHLICCNSLGELECYDKVCEYLLPKRYPAAEDGVTVEVQAQFEEAKAQKNGAEASCEVTLVVSGIVMEKQKLELLDEITCEEPLEREDDVALRVYYGRAGEELFEIAKRYHADPAVIAAESGTENEILQQDARLLIPAAE